MGIIKEIKAYKAEDGKLFEKLHHAREHQDKIRLQKDAVGDLINNELKKAQEEYGKTFASAHEGESVIREEIKEAREEYNYMKLEFNEVWSAVRRDNTKEQLAGVIKVHARARRAIEELIQVCAMCEKFYISFGTVCEVEETK